MIYYKTQRVNILLRYTTAPKRLQCGNCGGHLWTLHHKKRLNIIVKVEKLLALCDQLETKINENKTRAEQLMQAVLKEAFAQK